MIFSLASPFFFAVDNFANIGRAMTIVGIMAIGETIVIIGGGFDLSVGSIGAASAVAAAYVVDQGGDPSAAIALALAVGVTVGLVNGAITGYGHINPLITTLGTLAIVRGLAFVFTGGHEIVVTHQWFFTLVTGSVLSVPYMVLILVGLFLWFGFLIPRTRYGRYMYAIGSSARAAQFAGVDVNRWRLLLYGTSGLLAAFAGIITAARVGVAAPSANFGVELDVITAVILGGTSLTGGRGRLAGTFIGLFIIATLSNGLVLLSVPTYYQQIAKGGALLFAVLYDEFRRGRRERR